MDTDMDTDMELSENAIVLGEQQEAAAQAAEEYIKQFEAGETTKPFVLSGYAGTGKTFTVNQIVKRLYRTPAYMAYTGKAALVLKRYAKVPARTIHSTIYKPVMPDMDMLKSMYEKLEALKEGSEEHGELNKQIAEETKLRFVLKTEEEAFPNGENLIVLDECSMVDDELLEDLKSFGFPIFALGDPGQLPPINGTGALFKGVPDATLTEIRRQALDNPIIAWSMRARQMISLPSTDPDTMHEDRAARILRPMLNARQFEELAMSHDVIICWKNKTRRNINQWYRARKGYNTIDGMYPIKGEKLIITKNDREKGIFNGQFCEVIDIVEQYAESIKYKVLPEGDNPKEIEIDVLRACFDEYVDDDAMKRLRPWEFVGKQQADFGYCLTCHKAQGSQWERVLVIDENVFNWPKAYEDRARWLYTAVTRAAEKVTIIVEGRKR